MTEANTRLITIPEATFLALRDEYLGACNGDACAAALLEYFEGFSLWKRDERDYKEGEWEWVYISQAELPAKLRNLWGLTTIKARMLWLRELGYLATRKNDPYKWDQRLQYRFETETVQAAIFFQMMSEGEKGDQSISQMRPMDRSDATNRLVGSDLSTGQNQPIDEPDMTYRQARNDPSESLESFTNKPPLEIGSETTTTQESEPELESAVVVVDEQDQRIWDGAFHQLEMQIDRASFETWLRGARLLSVMRTPSPVPPFPETVFVVGVRNSYAQQMLAGRLYRNVRRVLSDVSGEAVDSIELRFKVLIPETPKPVSEDEDIPLFRRLSAEQPDYQALDMRGLYEKYIGVIGADDEKVIALIEQKYPVGQVQRAMEIMDAKRARSEVSDPVGYVFGILGRLVMV